MRGIATTAKAWTPRALLGVRLVLGPMLLVAAWNGNAGIGWVLILSADIWEIVGREGKSPLL